MSTSSLVGCSSTSSLIQTFQPPSIRHQSRDDVFSHRFYAFTITWPSMSSPSVTSFNVQLTHHTQFTKDKTWRKYEDESARAIMQLAGEKEMRFWPDYIHVRIVFNSKTIVKNWGEELHLKKRTRVFLRRSWASGPPIKHCVRWKSPVTWQINTL